MVTAVVKNGVFVPRDKLPDDWQDGTVVEVEKPACPSVANGDEIDRWLAELEAIAAGGDRAADRRLEAALADHKREQKELARKKAESP
jgi:hypothetical protein